MKTWATFLLATVLCLSCTAQFSFEHVIPIEAQRWYQLNTVADTAFRDLFDGRINKRVVASYGKILPVYESWYPVLDGEEMAIDSIRMYDGEGSFESNPMSIFVVTQNWERVKIASFKGSLYNQWVGPDPENPGRFSLSTPVKNFRYIVIRSANYNLPDEIVFFGTYKAAAQRMAATQVAAPLKNMFGVNAFEWDFEDPNNPTVIDESRMKPLQAFAGIRHYLDWDKLEPRKGDFTYNPTYNGGWNYDAIYERCQKDGIDVLACIKTLPPWMLASYPEDMRDVENVPAQYGADLGNPRSYAELARLGFQFAARYGSNKNINPALLSVYNIPRWTADAVNEVKTGLGLVKYIECENERDKWWKGRKAYQTAREYAASLSAFYDGHKNTMGPGIGVKNADPSMKVVMAGLADPSTDYVRGMIDWCREFRGLNADGSVNLCWDVINYHYYANDGDGSQNGESTRGAAPEVTTTAQTADAFVKMAQQYAQGMPVWMSETGYDLNPGSRLRAISIGSKTALETQADWTLRTALLYARTGIDRVFFFQLYDNHPENPTIFNSMGLVNADKTRRPAADYLYQTKKLMGDYVYKETIHSDPIVDRYEKSGKSIYMLVVPDEKGRTATYSLRLPTATAQLYRPTIGSDSMAKETVMLVNGVLKVAITETPIFVMPGEGSAAHSVPNDAGSISGPARLCQNATAEYSIAPVAGATRYQWQVPAGWTITSATDGNSITVKAGSSSGTIQVLPANTVGLGKSSNLNVSIQTTPSLAAVDGPEQACETSVVSYTTTGLGATSYNWSLSAADWKLNSSSTASMVEVLVGSGNSTLSVVAINECGTSGMVVVSLRSLPAMAALGNIEGRDVACAGATFTYALSAAAPAAAYAWSVPAGWSIVSGQGSPSISVVAGAGSGKISITASNSCGNVSANKSVTAATQAIRFASNGGTAFTRSPVSSCAYEAKGNEFDAVATSDCGPVSTLYWRLTGATAAEGSGTLAGVRFSAGKTVIAWRTDQAQSVEGFQTVVNIVDVTPPTILSPVSIKQVLTGNRCLANINVPKPEISDNCNVTHVGWTISGATSGRSASTGISYVDVKTFNVGVTYIDYLVRDAAGNESRSQFTITLFNPKCDKNLSSRTGLAGSTMVLSIKAFPNPSDNYFNIQLEGSGDEQMDIRVLDLMGRLVEKKEGVTAGSTLKMGQAYKPGFYIFEAIQGEQRKQLKLIKGAQTL